MQTDQKHPSSMPLILAAASAGLPRFNQTTGFHQCNTTDSLRAIEDAGLWIGPRPVLEENPNYRQTIPYIVLKYEDRIVQYTRTSAGGEKRLHGRKSIGLGGHVDLEDVVAHQNRICLQDTLNRAASRELDEELGVTQFSDQKWIGFIVDNDSAVGRVHIGIVGLWTLAEAPSGLVEDAIGDVELLTYDDLRRNQAYMETWSSMLLPEIAAQLGARGGARRAA